jgi:predicted RNase H-like nuclease (RuvC/YqgF family)
MTNDNDTRIGLNEFTQVTDAVRDVEEAVAELMSIIEEQKAEIIRLTEERDEARRELCNRCYGRLNARGEANLRGWDCYNKNQETT